MDEVKSNRRHIWISALLVIAAAGLVGGGVYYWQQQQLSSTKSSDQTQITGLNGKVADLTNQISAANTKIKSLSQPATPTTPAVDDKTAITNVVTADCEAQVGLTATIVTPVVVTSPFATAVVSCIKSGLTNYAGGTNHDILKKVNGQWVIIDQPTNGIDAATRQTYGIPASIQ